jgi:hypothetical protein
MLKAKGSTMGCYVRIDRIRARSNSKLLMRLIVHPICLDDDQSVYQFKMMGDVGKRVSLRRFETNRGRAEKKIQYRSQ